MIRLHLGAFALKELLITCALSYEMESRARTADPHSNVGGPCQGKIAKCCEPQHLERQVTQSQFAA